MAITPPGPTGRCFCGGDTTDCLVWGSFGPFDVNTASPALMEAMGMTPEMAASIVAARQQRPLQNTRGLGGALPQRIAVNWRSSEIYTLRASAPLRRSDGSYSEVVPLPPPSNTVHRNPFRACKSCAQYN